MKLLFTCHRYLVLMLLFIFMLALGSLLFSINSIWYPVFPKPISGSYLVLKFGFAVLFAPLVETLIFQHWLLQLFRKKLPFASDIKKWIWAILLSSFLFGLGHTQSPIYIIAAFCIGLLLASTYWLYSIRNDLNPILAVFLLHFFNNFLAFFLNDFIPWFI